MTKRRHQANGRDNQTAREDEPAQDVTRHIKPEVTAMLWGRAAGRCEFWGCNTELWKSIVTQERVNRAQRAHIYAFSRGGPRASKAIAPSRLNDIDNLMLVCHGCHRKIDQFKDGGRYTAELLRKWKFEHERRVEIVTGISATKQSTVVLYQVNVGQHSKPITFRDAANALFPRLHPSDDQGISLGAIDSPFTEKSPDFWEYESKLLRQHFSERISSRLSRGSIEHLSVFAIAPQPLLILLGTLLNDISSADVFQLHREPQTWNWPERSRRIEFRVDRPKSFLGTPALVVALSAPVADNRITDVLPNSAIWRITVPTPTMELIKSRAHLSTFRSLVRNVLDEITHRHGVTQPLHIFPVAGVSAAVELGRARMPKAHSSWVLYDQIAGRGFVSAIPISTI